MNVFIILAHPEAKSYNGAMFSTAVETFKKNGHNVKTSDLYRMNFNPVSGRHNFLTVKDSDYFKQQMEEMNAAELKGFAPEVEQEIQKVEWCDVMIWQFPLWWFGLPGVLQGWVDRVFAMGRTYGGGRIYENGFFKGKRAMLSLTTGGPKESYIKGGYNGDIYGVLRPIHRGMLKFVCFDVLEPNIVYGPVRMQNDERLKFLETYAQRLRQIHTESPIDVGEY